MVHGIRTIVASDRPVLRRNILRILQDESDIAVVGEIGWGTGIVDAVQELHPDLLILDGRISLLDGYRLLQRRGNTRPPFVVFLTDHDVPAAGPGDEQALGFVCSSSERSSLLHTLQHVKQTLSTSPKAGAGFPTSPADPPVFRLPIKSHGAVLYLQPEEICWLEAQRDYVRVHAVDRRYIIRRKIGDLAKELPSHLFARIHRSTIVALHRVREIVSRSDGAHTVILEDGTTLSMSRSRRTCITSHLAPKASR